MECQIRHKSLFGGQEKYKGVVNKRRSTLRLKEAYELLKQGKFQNWKAI